MLDWKTDGPLMGVATVLTVGDYYSAGRITAPMSAELKGLTSESINAIDIIAVGCLSDAADLRSDVGLVLSAAAGAIPVGLISLKAGSPANFVSEFTTLSVMFLETNLISYQATGLVKNVTRRYRPEVYHAEFTPDELPEAELIDLRESFFSRHVSVAAANSFFMAKVFSDYYPDSKWSGFVWTGAAVLPAWVGLERLLAGKHFPTDIVAGYVFGAACGYLIPHFHKRVDNESAVSFQASPFAGPYGSGAYISLRF